MPSPTDSLFSDFVPDFLLAFSPRINTSRINIFGLCMLIVQNSRGYAVGSLTREAGHAPVTSTHMKCYKRT